MRRRFAVVVLTSLVCLAFLEIGLRFIGRRPTNMTDGIATQHGDSFKLKSSIRKTLNYPAFSYTVLTNEFGFRDKAVGARDLHEKPFCVFLGASDVFGNGVEFEDTFVGIFESEASRQGMNVLNLAVGGHYFLDQESLLKEFMESTRLKPKTVYFTVNALHVPKFDQRNRNIIVKGGYTIDRKNWRLTYLRLTAGNFSSAYCFFRDAVRRIQERHLQFEFKVDSHEFLRIYSKSNPIRQPGRIQDFRKYLTDFEIFCRDNAIELVYIYLPLSDSFNLKELVKQIGANPDTYDASFYEELMQFHCREAGIKLVSPRSVLQGLHEEGKELRFKLDPHFNNFANRIIGNYLVKELL